jgi:hypothetical protein
LGPGLFYANVRRREEMAEEKVYTTTELKTTCLCGHVDRQHGLLEGECACSGCDCRKYMSLAGDEIGRFHKALEDILPIRPGRALSERIYQ